MPALQEFSFACCSPLQPSLRPKPIVCSRTAGLSLKPLVPIAPGAFVVAGSLGEWMFVVENARAARIVNLRRFAVLVWTRVESPR